MMPQNHERNNAEWLTALSRDDTIALRDLTHLLRRNLGRALGNRAGINEAALEDFVQDALLKITRSLESFRGDSRFLTWATAIAIRTAMTGLRRAHWKNVSLDDMMLDRLEHDQASPTQELDSQRREIVQLLYNMIEAELTPRQREAVLGSLAGVPQALLMERLVLTRNALYKLEHDARKKLKTGLESSGVRAEDVRELFHE